MTNKVLGKNVPAWQETELPHSFKETNENQNF